MYNGQVNVAQVNFFCYFLFCDVIGIVELTQMLNLFASCFEDEYQALLDSEPQLQSIY